MEHIIAKHKPLFTCYESHWTFTPSGLLYEHFFLILDCEAIGTAATPGLLCQPRVIMKMIVEK
jgi:hypothetical protein